MINKIFKRKLKIGIEIDEILRAKWLQFDRFYAQEFGDQDIPENPYTFDLFNDYIWKSTINCVKELREPDEIPDTINPIDYQTNENGEASADFLIFKPIEKKEISAKEMFNKFMYEDYLFEIHGSAPLMYKGMDLHINNFLLKYDEYAEFKIVSVENKFTIPPTLFFLSKMMSRFSSYNFVKKEKNIWKGIDVLITSNPNLLKKKPLFKKIIKINRPYNTEIKGGIFEVLHINDLINNKKFEKLINFKNKKQ